MCFFHTWEVDCLGQDHKDLQQDIDAFPYRIFHGNVDARILHRLKDCRLAPQVRLSEALSVQKAEDLEASFYRDTSYALAVSKITGDLIALLLTVVKNVSGIFRSDMTLMEFVEVFTLVDNMPKCQTHPDSLQQIVASSVHLSSLVFCRFHCTFSISKQDVAVNANPNNDETRMTGGIMWDHVGSCGINWPMA